MWQNVNEVSKRARAKLKATSQEERMHLRKEYFKNLLGKTPKVTKSINYQFDIKLGQITQEEPDIVVTKRKNTAGVDEIPPEVWKTRKFNFILFQCYHTVKSR